MLPGGWGGERDGRLPHWSGARDVGARAHEAGQGHHFVGRQFVARHLLAAQHQRLEIGIAQRRVGMHEEGAHADHVQVQRLEDLDVLRQVLVPLTRNPDHHPAPDLVAHPPQPPQQRDPVRFGEAPAYGWSEDKFRQYSEPQRVDFGAFIPGWRTAWVADPDGIIVEISQGFVDQDNPPSLAGA